MTDVEEEKTKEDNPVFDFQPRRKWASPYDGDSIGSFLRRSANPKKPRPAKKRTPTSVEVAMATAALNKKTAAEVAPSAAVEPNP